MIYESELKQAVLIERDPIVGLSSERRHVYTHGRFFFFLIKSHTIKRQDVDQSRECLHFIVNRNNAPTTIPVFLHLKRLK